LSFNPKTLHIELTNLCSLECPFCPRTECGVKKISHFSREWFESLEVEKFELVNCCGTFGDPIYYPHLHEFMEHLNRKNEKIWVSINTNGSIHDKKWWQDFAKVLPKNHTVVFAIDGLAETHKIYRINSDFDKVIKNASNFIRAGGNAEWWMTLFKHNEKDINIAKKLSKGLGFKSFVMRPSFYYSGKFERPESNIKTRRELSKMIKKDVYSCRISSGELFVDSYGRVLPCCHMYDTNISRLLTGGVLLTVHKRRISEIINSGYLDRILSRLHKVKQCSSCKIIFQNVRGESVQTLINFEKELGNKQ